MPEMDRLKRLSMPLLLAGTVIAGAWFFWPRPVAQPAGGLDPAAFIAALNTEAEGFAPVGQDWDFVFPRDQGPHPQYRTEVWDLSGQMVDDTGRRYGLRLSFLRIGLSAPSIERSSGLAANNLLLARFALAAEGGEEVITSQRVSRAAAGLAGAKVSPARVWLEDWSLEQGADPGTDPNLAQSLRLQARLDDLRLTLVLKPHKPVVTQSEARLFEGAGGGEGRGFHFYLQPRLSAEGRLTLGAGLESKAGVGKGSEVSLGSNAGTDAGAIAVRAHQGRAVTGSVWLERAWGAVPGTFAGGRGQLALNRFALQLDDDSELMCVHLRRRAGGGTPVPTCLAIAQDGTTRLLQRRELTLEPTGGDWTNPADGVEYPLQWRLRLPALGLDLALRPLLANQPMELGLGEPAWSGTVTLSGSRDGNAVGGSGRMDLNGYAASPEI